MRYIVLCVMLILLSVHSAVAFTDAQYTTIGTDINSIANAGVLASAIASRDDSTIADFYNQLASPTVTLWIPRVTRNALINAVVASEFVTLTVNQQNTWFVLMQADIIDATQARVRTNFSTVFSTLGPTTLTNLTAAAQRSATRLEALFVTVAGSANVSSVYGQVLTARDVAHSLRGVPVK